METQVNRSNVGVAQKDIPVDKTLVIVNTFPPTGGVGARRWAKFVKYFSRYERYTHVLTFVDKPSNITWEQDIEKSEFVEVSRVSRRYPSLHFNPKFKLFRAFNRITREVLKRLYKLDYAEKASENIIRMANSIINRHNIKNIIVSGPPHSLLYCGAILKVQNPNINLCLDYRDSWNDEGNYHYPTSIKSLKSKTKSIQMEQFALQVADSVVLVTEDMRQRMIRVYPQYKNKFHIVYNGYDIEDYNLDLASDTSQDMVYVGTIHGGRKKAIELLAEVIENNQIPIKLHLYTDSSLGNFSNSKVFSKIKKCIIFHKMVRHSELSAIINKYNYCLSINAENYPHAFGTKIFDYMVFDKTVLHISNGGELYELLTKSSNSFVSTYDANDLRDNLLEMINSKRTQLVTNFDRFSIQKLTSDFTKLLK